jgi:hypothetical protein
LPRITLEFTLSGSQVQQDLLQEFALHHDVDASAADRGDVHVIRVETSDAPGAMWEVRATVGMFDDRAAELTDQP